jgi:hypothetical protein
MKNRTVAWTSNPCGNEVAWRAAELGHRNENRTPGSRTKIPCRRQQEALSREQGTKPFLRSSRTKLNWEKRDSTKAKCKDEFFIELQTQFISEPRRSLSSLLHLIGNYKMFLPHFYSRK